LKPRYPGDRVSTCSYNPGLRRPWLLRRLAQADGLAYDQLCGEVIAAFPHSTVRFRASARGVRAVRDLLSEGLAVTERDASVWLTPDGWAALAALDGDLTGAVAR